MLSLAFSRTQIASDYESNKDFFSPLLFHRLDVICLQTRRAKQQQKKFCAIALLISAKFFFSVASIRAHFSRVADKRMKNIRSNLLEKRREKTIYREHMNHH